jgi:hypothetical protein
MTREKLLSVSASLFLRSFRGVVVPKFYVIGRFSGRLFLGFGCVTRI